MTDDELDAIESRVTLATSEPMKRNFYESGGGRMFVDGESGQRKLVLDAYSETDRDFYFSARQDVDALLKEVDRLKNVLRFIDQLDTTQEHWWPTCLKYAKHALANGPVKQP